MWKHEDFPEGFWIVLLEDFQKICSEIFLRKHEMPCQVTLIYNIATYAKNVAHSFLPKTTFPEGEIYLHILDYPKFLIHF